MPPPGESQKDRSCWFSLRRLISLIFAGWLPHEVVPRGAASPHGLVSITSMHRAYGCAEYSPPTVLPSLSVLWPLCVSSLRHQLRSLISAINSQATSPPGQLPIRIPRVHAPPLLWPPQDSSLGQANAVVGCVISSVPSTQSHKPLAIRPRFALATPCSFAVACDSAMPIPPSGDAREYSPSW